MRTNRETEEERDRGREREIDRRTKVLHFPQRGERADGAAAREVEPGQAR